MESLSQSTRRPDITFCRNGRIDIAARIVRLLSIKPGDVIDITKDRSEYYLCVRFRAESLVGRHKGQCFPSARRSMGTFRAWSKQLASVMIEASQPGKEMVKLPCGNVVEISGRKYIPIIIKLSL